MLRECGVDWTDVERLCGDRDGWKVCVRERMRHLDRWERQQGHRHVWGVGEGLLERNEGRMIDLECRYEGCGKVCKSKGGLVQHQKRMHRAPPERVRFECGRCGMMCETEVACVNHERTCEGGRVGGNQRECVVCGEWVSRTSFARHVRGCRSRQGGTAADNGDEVGASGERVGRSTGERARGRVAECQLCGRTLSYTNMARHQRSCRVWDPGGGPRP